MTTVTGAGIQQGSFLLGAVAAGFAERPWGVLCAVFYDDGL
jgi:hypothetical protein